MRSDLRNWATWIVATAFALTPVFITPWWNFDPINVPRVLLVSTLGFPAFYIYIDFVFNSRKKGERGAFDPLFLIFSCIALLAIFSTLFFSEKPFTRQFYGTQGRNNGALVNLCLLGLLAAATLTKRNFVDSQFKVLMLFGGLLNLAYTSLQFFGKDPIAWQNPFSPLVGTLGNPNFLSAFLAFFGIFLISQILSVSKLFTKVNLIYVPLLIWDVVLVYLTKSIQGLVVLAFGLVFLFYLRYFAKTSIILKLLLVEIGRAHV